MVQLTLQQAMDKAYNDITLLREKFKFIETDRPVMAEMFAERNDMVLLKFESGKRLLYKPKDIGCDEALEHLLGELSCGLPAVKSLAFNGCGWQEYIAEETAKPSEKYYYDSGMLTALACVLGSRDLFRDNIRIKSGIPVVTDAEMIIYPRFKSCPDSNIEQRLLSTCLMPGMYGVDVDVGGIVFENGYGKFLDNFADGFAEMMRVLDISVKNRIEDLFCNTTIRIVLRKKTLYEKLIQEAHSHDENTFKMMANYLLRRRDLSQQVTDYESDCLFRGELPVFSMKGSSRDLYLGSDAGIIIKDFARMSAIECAYEGVELLFKQHSYRGLAHDIAEHCAEKIGLNK